jgi:HEPN domain-containing protein
LKNEAAFLEPFAMEFRYPGEYLAPEYDDVVSAIEFAEKIFNFVKDRINESDQ